VLFCFNRARLTGGRDWFRPAKLLFVLGLPYSA
jgi:hypothetical protein